MYFGLGVLASAPSVSMWRVPSSSSSSFSGVQSVESVAKGGVFEL